MTLKYVIPEPHMPTEEEIQEMEERNNKQPNHLENWFPAVIAAKVPYPETRIIAFPRDVYESMTKAFDGKPIGEKAVKWLEFVHAKIENSFGYPCFLRSSITSDKHSWKNSCYIDNMMALKNNIVGILEYCCMSPYLRPTTFVVRKLIPTKTVFTTFYGDMPITKERRYFVKGDKVVCHHPYWPEEAFLEQENLPDNWKELLAEMNAESTEEIQLLTQMAESVGRYLKGYWSIDFLCDKDGKWWCIDMATGAESYHWEGCSMKRIIQEGS